MVHDVYTRQFQLLIAEDEPTLNLEPIQGLWTEEQYLCLTDYARRYIEFTDGVLEILPYPTSQHHDISGFLFFALHKFVEPSGGKVMFGPLRLQIREGKYREPDLLLLLDAHDLCRENAFWLCADLVIEIVSPGGIERDTVTKRTDYAEGRIPDYWIVNPLDETITVLWLEGKAYTEHGVFRRGDTATSLLMEGFAVEVSAVLDAR